MAIYEFEGRFGENDGYIWDKYIFDKIKIM